MMRLKSLFEMHGGHELIIPEYGYEGQTYPGEIEPGVYSQSQVVEMINRNSDNPRAIQFIADMLE